MWNRQETALEACLSLSDKMDTQTLNFCFFKRYAAVQLFIYLFGMDCRVLFGSTFAVFLTKAFLSSETNMDVKWFLMRMRPENDDTENGISFAFSLLVPD